MKDKKKLLTWADAWKINRRAYALIYKRSPQMIISRIICIIWEALTPFIGIWLSAQIINELSGGKDASTLTRLVLITLGSAALISIISAFLHRWRNSECAGLYYRVQQVFSEKMMDMDFVDSDDTKVHEMYNTIDQNQNGGGWGLIQVYEHIESIISSVITLLGGIVLTISLFTSKVPFDAGRYTVMNNPLFILLIIVVMLAITYISPMLSTKAGSYYAMNSDSHNLGNRLFGFFGWLGYDEEYATDVRMYRQDLICDKHNSDKTGIFCSKGMFAKFAKGPIGFYNAASAAVSVLFTGVVYVFVCLKALGGAFGIGSVTQYIASITKLSGGVSSFISTVGDMRNNASFLNLIFKFLDIPNNMYQGTLTVEKRIDRDYEIEFRDVSFKYPGNDIYAIRHVNMKFRIGERLAVVGQNGSGKTTFIKLLCRLYDPTEGEILLNGIDIRKYNYADYLSVFSVVFQDFKLLAFNIGQNVATEVNYNKEIVEDCLQKAGFGTRIKELPDGIETYLYKELSKTGVDISGGEAQKIALARALYKEAPFIVLDEPTAALDPIAEAEIYSKFNDIVGDKTAIYISHRLSSCRFCDEIIVFDSGQIVQQGSHDNLVSDEKGKYHELWNAQAQYYV